MKFDVRTGARAIARWGTALALCGLGLTALAAGCAEPPSSTGAADERLLSRAVVRFAPDGTYTVQYSWITVAEQQEELTARARAAAAPADGLGTAAEAITQDGSCTSSDDEFFDEPVGTPANEVCFSGTGTIDLSTVARGSGNWAGAIQSYNAQASIGHASGNHECFDFNVTTVQTNDASLGLSSLTLGSHCCSGTEQWCYCSKCPSLSRCETSAQACFNFCATC